MGGAGDAAGGVDDEAVVEGKAEAPAAICARRRSKVACRTTTLAMGSRRCALLGDESSSSDSASDADAELAPELGEGGLRCEQRGVSVSKGRR